MPNTDISSAAAALGRRGGKSTSDAKRVAARENGRKGGRPAMNKIVVDESSLSDFLGADGDVTGAKLERRMDRYCAWIQARMENVRVTHGPTSGTDDVPDELRQEYESIAAQAADNLDIICGRGKLI